jgi:hypothetical protein
MPSSPQAVSGRGLFSEEADRIHGAAELALPIPVFVK